MPRALQATAGAEDTHVLMNYCHANYGSTNARELAAMLDAELVALAGSPPSVAGSPASG